MSDFLTSLAARSLAQPTLRPRTPSRFESVSAEEPAGSFEAPVARPRLAAPSFESVAPSPEDEQTVAAPERLERTIVREVPRDRVEVVEKPFERVVEKTSPPRVVTERVETPPRVITERVEAPARVITERAEPPASSPEQPKALPHRHDAQPPRVLTREERHERTVTIERERERERERTFRTTVERERVLRGTSAPSRPSDTTPSTSEPVVHVSIGRIEVRAVTQPEHRQQRPSRKAPMSIDDYAARRDAKERR